MAYGEKTTKSNLGGGDVARNYAGGNPPISVRYPLRGSSADMETPETILEAKERWEIVVRLVYRNDCTRPHANMIFDYFDGDNYEQLGVKYSMSPHMARYHVLFCLDYLKESFDGEIV